MNKRTYITGGDIKYLQLIEVMANSLNQFLPNDIDLIVYTFNCEYQIPGINTKRIDIPKTKDHNSLNDITKKDNSLFYAKFYATLDAFDNYEYVCWIDGDAFVLPAIGNIWKYLNDLNDIDYPLFMHYLDTDIIFWKKLPGLHLKIEGRYGAELATLFGTQRNTHSKLIATGLYLTNRKHKQFFIEALDLWNNIQNKECYIWADNHAFSEERIANYILWKNSNIKTLPFTWVNLHSQIKQFDDYSVESMVLDRGFDVMYDETNTEVIMIHGPNPIKKIKKTKEVLEKEYLTNINSANNLMIVAHPDDETIFGGYDLLIDDSWEVVCLTNKNNIDRANRFRAVMKELSISNFYIYDLPDELYSKIPEEKAKSIIKNHIDKKSWTKIVTHNLIGEYGHPHHNQIHNIVKELVDLTKLYMFKKGEALPTKILDKKLKLIKVYGEAYDFANQIRTHNGRWFIESDMSTNYIDHGRSVKYYDYIGSDTYIPCFLK